jgi:hypothetical protein
MSEHLAEYNLTKKDEGYSARPTVTTALMGNVMFLPNPAFDGRMVVVCDTADQQEELLQNGNVGGNTGGKRVIVVPPDLMGSQEEARIRGLVQPMVEEIVQRLVPSLIADILDGLDLKPKK